MTQQTNQGQKTLRRILKPSFLESERLKWWVSIGAGVVLLSIHLYEFSTHDGSIGELGIFLLGTLLLSSLIFVFFETIHFERVSRRMLIRTALGNRKLLVKIPDRIDSCFARFGLERPEEISEGFREIIRHVFDPASKKLRYEITDIMQQSTIQTLHHGFVITNADFSDYTRHSNEMVERLYNSNVSSQMWTVCLYCPLSYLIMSVLGKKQDRPVHLLLFNGFQRINGSLIQNHSTNRVRILFLSKKTFERVFAGDPFVVNGMQLELRKEFLFAYIWLLLYNTNIHLFWRWREHLRTDLQLSDKDDEEDFMVFDETYFLRYNIQKHMLSVCWNWNMLGYRRKITTTAMAEIFRKALSLKQRGFCTNLTDLILEQFESDTPIFNTFHTSLTEVIADFEKRPDWAKNQLDPNAEIAGKLMVERIIMPLRTRVSRLDGLKGLEQTVIESVTALSESERVSLYTFVESEAFGSAVRTFFPSLTPETAVVFRKETHYEWHS